MHVANGIEMLEIAAEIVGRVTVINPTLLWDDETVILVDTGYPGQSALIREAMEKAGVPFARLTSIILTHQDLDHIGSLPDLLREAAQQVEVMTSAAEQPFIQGEKRPLRLTPEVITRMMNSLPADYPEERRLAFQSLLEHPPTAKVDRTLADGEELSCAGGITVIATPGHTPGHLCLYHRRSKTLIAGDALAVVDGQLTQNIQYIMDIDEARKSLQKVIGYDIEKVICYHGGLLPVMYSSSLLSW